ncbi:unnamed protein product [Natator depressus]
MQTSLLTQATSAPVGAETHCRGVLASWLILSLSLSSYCVYFRLKQVGAACHLHWWSSQLMRERRVCVECRPDAVGSGARCQGDGLEGARTFWTAPSIAGCQGSWIQESLQENCVCPLLSLIFV